MNSAGIQIRPLETAEEADRVEDLQRAIWPGSETDVVPAHLLVTIAKNGGVLLGAYDGDDLIGFVLGFLGTDSSSPERVAMARLKFCSHMLGVHPSHRDRGVGFLLKIAQRQAVIDQGIRLATWTYDPLVSRNAYLNIRRLGAVCRTYVRSAYGRMRDSLNEGVDSDRFQVDWWVTSSRVESRVKSNRPPLDLANFFAAGAEKVNSVVLGDDGLPRPDDGMEFRTEATLALAEIPSDFARIKAQDIGLAQAWRAHSRTIFEELFKRGYIVTDFVFLKGEKVPRSYYLLSHGEGTLG